MTENTSDKDIRNLRLGEVFRTVLAVDDLPKDTDLRQQWDQFPNKTARFKIEEMIIITGALNSMARKGIRTIKDFQDCDFETIDMIQPRLNKPHRTFISSAFPKAE